MARNKNDAESQFKCRKTGKSVESHFKEYCRNTSIDGLRYLGEERPVYERIWWMIAVIVCIFLSGIMIYEIILKYKYYPVVVTFSMKETRLQKLPFPAVTICPRAKISQKYLNLTALVLKQLSNVSLTDEENKQMDIASTICDFDITNKTKNIEEQEFFTFLKKSRMDVFHYCSYLGQDKNCTELFTPMLTEEGFVILTIFLIKAIFIKVIQSKFIFNDFHISPSSNWNVEDGFPKSNEDPYPRRALRVGAKNQLMVILKVRHENIEYQCPSDESGYRVSIHLPSDIPEVPENYILVPLNQRVIGAIIPYTIKTSQGVKNFDPSKRDCYFQSERPLKFFKKYSHENCMLECKTNYTLNECGCVGFHMPKELETPICLLNGVYCMERALEAFSSFNEEIDPDDEGEETKNEKSCDCKQTCTDISYRTDLSYSPVLYNIINTTLKEEINFEDHVYTILSLYFKNSHVETKERNEIYGFSDLISNFGGLLGLFTGFSIISFLEIFYFLSLRIWGNLQMYGTWISPNDI